MRRVPSVAPSRPTIEMVAGRAGVSRQTVSNALNAPERLRPETLAAVLRVVEELGYRPSHAARSLKSRATKVIGCRLLPSNPGGTGGVLDRLLHALCDTAHANGYDILTFSAEDDAAEISVYDDLLRREAVDGFVLTNTHHLDRRPGWLIDHGAKLVAFGRPWGVRAARHSWVDVDGAKGTSEAVHHLARLGHARIAFLGVPEGIGVGDDRYAGWERATRQLRLAARGLVLRAEDGIDSGWALTEQLLGLARPPSGLVCVSDAMALGALRAIEDRGLRAGTDVSVVGFDDSPVAGVIRPGLSSVRQPIEAVANELVEVLLAELGGSLSRPVRKLLAPRLVVRETSGASPTGPPVDALLAGVPLTAQRPATTQGKEAVQ